MSLAGLLHLASQRGEGALGFAQVAADLVEADPGEPGDDLLLAVLRRDDDDVLFGGDDHARLLGEPAVRGHVDRAAQVPGREVLRRPGVDHDRSCRAPLHELLDRQRPGRGGGVEQSVFLAVEDGVVDEVGGRGGLPLGDQRDEFLLVHRLYRRS